MFKKTLLATWLTWTRLIGLLISALFTYCLSYGDFLYIRLLRTLVMYTTSSRSSGVTLFSYFRHCNAVSKSSKYTYITYYFYPVIYLQYNSRKLVSKLNECGKYSTKTFWCKQSVFTEWTTVLWNVLENSLRTLLLSRNLMWNRKCYLRLYITVTIKAFCVPWIGCSTR